jgi:hypothetical protein
MPRFVAFPHLFLTGALHNRAGTRAGRLTYFLVNARKWFANGEMKPRANKSLHSTSTLTPAPLPLAGEGCVLIS